METITPAALKERLASGEKLHIIDVREPEETALGIIDGAVNIPLMTIPERLADVSQEGETIIVCRSGARSGRAIEYLQAQGYTNLKNMSGGMLEWEQL
ncbi:rhodanese-like domain-containing protein [Paenibacillus sp. YYML68]|uniref:rhodanese-like domain-containing protein n=1 Tax=Paenibacillus sp. YYML68 TaxID=2909250 RepID=UPI00248F62AE|nr:rhodanese-like domain-containing protein [Paenibacillus sp. YYML68]